MPNRAGKGDPAWNIDPPYHPAIVHRMLNIAGVFSSLSKKGDDKKTPAMRFGLASVPVDIVRIINHRLGARFW